MDDEFFRFKPRPEGFDQWLRRRIIGDGYHTLNGQCHLCVQQNVTLSNGRKVRFSPCCVKFIIAKWKISFIKFMKYYVRIRRFFRERVVPRLLEPACDGFQGGLYYRQANLEFDRLKKDGFRNQQE